MGESIGGCITSKKGSGIYYVSGPVKVHNVLEAEIAGITHVFKAVLNLRLHGERVVICSNNTQAINLIHEGLTSYFSLEGSVAKLLETLNSSVFVEYVSRDLNLNVDNLAKYGLSRSLMVHNWVRN